MFLNVALSKDERETLVIPEEALTPEAEKQFVFVVADGKAARREVRIGGRSPGNVEVIGGLEAGERVIVEGTQKVRDGAAVNAIDRVADSLPTTDNGAGDVSEHAASASPTSLRQ
jgi:membrane fusion protein (multidrug efflux system)